MADLRTDAAPGSGSGRRGGASSAFPRARLGAFLAVVCCVVALDQAVKAWARANLVPGDPVTLVPHVMDLSLVYNTGAAFSLGEGAGPVFVLVAAAIALAGLWLCVRRPDAPLSLVLVVASVAGGGIGNAIDRVAQGAVTDFFATTFVRFAVFNVADVFVTVGTVLGFILWWRWDSARERAGARDSRAE